MGGWGGWVGGYVRREYGWIGGWVGDLPGVVKDDLNIKVLGLLDNLGEVGLSWGEHRTHSAEFLCCILKEGWVGGWVG